MVLRISRLTTDNAVTLKLEGKLLAPWVDEVRSACRRPAGGALRRQLDLSQLTYVDDRGLGLLRDLLRGGFEISRCSHFIAELLRMEESS
ncbi:MAG: hypothetical protein HRF43_16440 [Phycisphaerae bacterium]